MSLKEELAKIEIEEEEIEVEDRLSGIQESIYGLYRRIGVIVEYIDNQTKEVTTITEEQLRQDEQHFREEGIRKAWELKNLELNLKIKKMKEALKEEVKDRLEGQPTTEEEIERRGNRGRRRMGLGRAVGDV